MSTKDGLLLGLLLTAALLTAPFAHAYLPIPEVNEIIRIENAIFELETPLVFRGNSSLIVENGTLILGSSQEYYTWPYLNFTDNSKLIIINSKIVGTPDSSNIIVMGQGSNLTIIKSEVSEEPHEYSDLFLPRLIIQNATAIIKDSHLHYINIGGTSNATITDTNMTGLASNTVSPVRVINCTIGNIRLIYYYREIEINETFQGFYQYWDSNLISSKPNQPQNFILINSTLKTPPQYNIYHSNATIRDCNMSWLLTDGDMSLSIVNASIAYIRCIERGTLNISITDANIGELSSWITKINARITSSEIEVLSMSAQHSINMTVENCIIGELRNYETQIDQIRIRDTTIDRINMIQSPGKAFDFENVTISKLQNGRSRGGTRLYLQDIAFTENPGFIIGPNQTMSVVRYYRIRVTKDGAPANGVRILNITDTLTASLGTTDGDGEATIKVYYILTNSTAPKTKTVWIDENPIELGVFTDSPIELNMLVRTPRTQLIATLIIIMSAIAAYIALASANAGIIKT